MFKRITTLRFQILKKKLKSNIRAIIHLPYQLQSLRDLILYQQTVQLQSAHPNPLNKFGKKCYSQTDEDGITLEILKRIGIIKNGIYAEFGVGDGTENNSLILATLGWKGFWVGGEDILLDWNSRHNTKFAYLKEWITLENIVDLTKKGLALINAEKLDVVSLDLDGNDIFFVNELLSNNIRPKLFIVEYNAKFPPPVEFEITYDSQHTWKRDDYFGASLSSFNKLFEKFNYMLVCCNSHSGANAFFIDSAYSEYFSDVPTDINQIYVEPRFHLYYQYGHKQSLKTIEKILNER